MVKFGLEEGIVPRLTPVAEEVDLANRSKFHEDLLIKTSDFLTGLDEILAPVERPQSLRGNCLGFIALGVECPQVHEGVDIERERGFEGFSPNTIVAVFPENKLSSEAYELFLENYEAWKSHDQDQFFW